MLAKTFSIRERYKAQFRWEMYNSTNTLYFGQPASSFGAGNFGIVTAASSRRIMQFGLRLHW